MTHEELWALVTDLRANGVAVTLEDGKVHVSPWSEVQQIERKALREHRDELVPLLAGPVEADHLDDRDDDLADDHLDEPEVFVYGRRIREHHVRECLVGDSDNLLADYDAGRLSKSDAYRMTAVWMRNWMEMTSGNPRAFSPTTIFSPRATPSRREHVDKSNPPHREHRRKAHLR